MRTTSRNSSVALATTVLVLAALSAGLAQDVLIDAVAPAALIPLEEPSAAELPDAVPEDPVLDVTLQPTPGNISMDLVDIEIGEAVKLVTRLTGASIISSTNMTQRVSATILDKPWQPALEMLLEQCNLRLTERQDAPGIYVIGPRVDDMNEPWITETFKLSFVKASEAAEMLKSMLGIDDPTVKSKAAAKKSAQKSDDGEPIKEDVEVVFRKDGRVASYPSGNMVVVSTTETKMAEVRKVLLSIDLPRQQVYIEAKIIELTGDASKKIGIDWEMLDGYGMGVGGLGRDYRKTTTREKGSSDYRVGENATVTDHRGRQISTDSAAGLGVAGSAAALLPSTVAAAAEATPTPSSYAGVNSAIPGSAAIAGANEMAARFTSVTDIRTAVFGADALTLVLSALQRSGDAFLVSNPKVIVANEERAIIDMAIKEPYVTVEQKIDGTGDNTTYTFSTKMAVIPGNAQENKLLPYIEQAFFTYGIKLEVTPRINNPSNITVTVSPTLSSLLDYYTPGGEGLTRYPRIQSKHVKTIFSLDNGQTAVIGGLTTTKDNEIVKKVPLLGDIPWIGTYLFSHTEKIKEQRETIIFVTVGIVDPRENNVAMSVPEASRLIHDHVTPEGRLLSAEEVRAAQAQKLRALEQGTIMEPLGADDE